MNGNAVRVMLWGETVGYLTWDSSNWRTTTAVFSFAKDFLEKGLDISPLRMPLGTNLVQSRQSIRGTSPKERFGGLHPVFADFFLTIGETASSASGQRPIKSV